LTYQRVAAEASAASGAASTSGSGTAAAGFIVTEAPGGKKPLQSWEKVYWGAIAVGVCGIAWYYTDDLRNAKDPEVSCRWLLCTLPRGGKGGTQRHALQQECSHAAAASTWWACLDQKGS
jgi:hypothetical protein